MDNALAHYDSNTALKGCFCLVGCGLYYFLSRISCDAIGLLEGKKKPEWVIGILNALGLNNGSQFIIYNK